MTYSSNQTYSILFIAIFAFATLINLLNINAAKSSGVPLIHGSTIDNVDNIWYLNQVKNYMSGDGFTIDPDDPIMSVRRTPGYPLFYGVHYSLFGEEYAHKIIPYTQTFIFVLSAVLLGIISTFVTGKLFIGYWVTIMYGLSLPIIGFLSYTITESLHPSLVIFSLYYLIRFLYKEKYPSNRCLILSAVFCALATLVRPTDGIMLITLISALLVGGRAKKIKIQPVFIVFFTFGVLFAPWVIHNYIKIDKLVPLEAYYQNHTFGGHGAKNIALYDWWSSWGAPKGVALHEKISLDAGTDSPHSSIKKFINNIPEYAYVDYTKDDLYSALVLYQDCIKDRYKHYNGVTDINLIRQKWGEKILECESGVSNAFDNLRDKIKQGNPLRYYFIAPILVRGSQYIFHSFSAHIPFLAPNDGKYTKFQYSVKAFLYIVNVLLWVFSAMYFLLRRDLREKIIIGSFFLISFVILIYSRHVEGRYMLAAYPFMYIMSSITIMSVANFFKNKVRKSLPK